LSAFFGEAAKVAPVGVTEGEEATPFFIAKYFSISSGVRDEWPTIPAAEVVVAATAFIVEDKARVELEQDAEKKEAKDACLDILSGGRGHSDSSSSSSSTVSAHGPGHDRAGAGSGGEGGRVLEQLPNNHPSKERTHFHSPPDCLFHSRGLFTELC